MREVADNIALLHKLVAEMNDTCKKLAALGIDVWVQASSRFDPLGSDGAAAIRLEMSLHPKIKE